MIEVSRVSKDYRIKGAREKGSFLRKRELKRAVDDVSFSISPGELVGYIGPNGAGKSTTIKMMTGILLPDEGTIRVNGIDPFHKRKENGRNIGVLFGQRSQLWYHLRLDDTLRLFQHMYEIPQAQYEKRLATLRDILELDEFWAQPVRQLSLGQRMRGELAAALIHSPSILYLDEPTIGMDVLVKERIRTLLAEINEQDGVTVLLTTHDLDDIERLCRRVMVINHGKLLYDGTMESLRAHCPADSTISIDFMSTNPILPDGLRDVKRDGLRVSFSMNRHNHEENLLVQVVSQNAVRDISIAEPPIEEVVRALYEGGAEL